MLTIMTVFGTRPEAIKMAPVIKEMEKHPEQIRSIVTLSAQHREMLDQVLEIFDIHADYDLDIMTANQKLTDITSSVLKKLEPILEKEQVDLVLVQGDTTTTFAAALVAFYYKIPVGHIEAGLRTNDRYYPFPEEINRRLTSTLTTIHFAPTQLAKDNLLREGYPESSIVITGNTVIDALLRIVEKEGYAQDNSQNNIKEILVTAHRRESWGKPLENICHAILDIVNQHKDVRIVFPVHLNPNVRKTVFPLLSNNDQIYLCDPLDYLEFTRYMARAYLILTDSGGIQEEAPALGKPVLVMRGETERLEGIDAGTCRLVGTDRSRIVEEVNTLLTESDAYSQMAHAVNPYGDGKSSQRIVQYVLEYFGSG